MIRLPFEYQLRQAEQAIEEARKNYRLDFGLILNLMHNLYQGVMAPQIQPAQDPGSHLGAEDESLQICTSLEF